MKKIKLFIASISATLTSANSAFAQAVCKINGEVVPCESLPKLFWMIPVVLLILSIIGFVFWLIMLIDAIKNEKEDKFMWVVMIIFLNILGAILYYFIAKRKRDKSGQNK